MKLRKDSAGSLPSKHSRAVIFRLRETKASQSAGALVGYFSFTNDSGINIMVPGFGAPVQGVFRPHYVDYEVAVPGGWKSLGVGYDGIPREVAIPPGETVFQISLGPFQVQKVPATAEVRVRAGEYWSDPFTLALGTTKSTR